MGRQVRFFNYPSDVPPLEAFALAENEAVFIQGSAPNAEAVTVPSLGLDAAHPSRYGLLIVRPDDLPNLRWRHIPGRDRWLVDKWASPVIEYTPGYGKDGRPSCFASRTAHGRIWFETSRWEGDQLVRADPDFVSWANRLFRWIKKNWILIDREYFSPRAAEVWKQMWRVVLDEPCDGTGGDQISRWRRNNDPDNVLPHDAVHVTISRAARDRPRWLTIAVRATHAD
jgi:hypothetical protein